MNPANAANFSTTVRAGAPRRSIIFLLGLSTVCVGATFVQPMLPAPRGLASVAEPQFVQVLSNAIPISDDPIEPKGILAVHDLLEQLSVRARRDVTRIIAAEFARSSRCYPIILREICGPVATRVVGDGREIFFWSKQFVAHKPIRNASVGLAFISGMEGYLKIFGDLPADEQSRAFPVDESGYTPRSGLSRLLGNGNLPLHRAGLPLQNVDLPPNREPCQCSEGGIHERDIYDDPFGALPRQRQLLVALLFAIVGWSLVAFGADRLFRKDDRIRLWCVPLMVVGFALWGMAIGLAFLGHPWPPKQQYYRQCEDRQTARHHTGTLARRHLLTAGTQDGIQDG